MKAHPVTVAVKQLRIALGYSQQAFAGQLGLSLVTVNRYENHHVLPNGTNLARLERLALEHGFKDCAAIFHQALYNNHMPLDARDKITMDSLETRYTYHAPDPLQVEQYRSIRAAALRLAQIIVEECPSSPERSTALTNLDAAVMFANAAIARNAGSEPA